MNFIQAVAAARRVPVAPSGIVTSGLIHQWDPYNIVSTNMPDIVGTDDFTLYAGLQTGLNLPWLDFDGVNDYAGTGTNYTPPDMKFNMNDPFTICLWLKIRFSDFSGAYGLFGSQLWQVPYSGFSLQVGSSGTRTRLAFVLRKHYTQDREVAYLATSLAQNTPFYYTVTYNGVRNSGGMKVYVNAVNDTGNTISNVSTSNPTVNYNAELQIGSFQNFSAYCPMNLGASHIYDRELSPAEVAQNFNATRATYGI